LGPFLEGLAMEDVGVFYGHLISFTAIWHLLWPFGIFIFPILVYRTKKNLATMVCDSYLVTWGRFLKNGVEA
jgi:hypothetical protein